MTRILGSNNHFGKDYSNSPAVSEALIMLQEKAALGVISVFGRPDWRKQSPINWDKALRLRIPPEVFRTNYFEPLWFFQQPEGGLFEPQETIPRYLDIWFDGEEIDRLWPQPWVFPWKIVRAKSEKVSNPS